jgi:hypothetical protein
VRRHWGKSAALAAALLILAAAALASAVEIQQGNLRISFFTQLQPYRLPRIGTAPIAVFIVGHIAAVDGTTPPQLQRMDVKINRHGHLDSVGLPVCHIKQIQSSSTQRALEKCGDALVGSGHFRASVVFDETRPYHTTGRLLAFNGARAGKPVLLAHIYTTEPFPSSFVVTFAIHHIAKGPYGTELSASLPQALGSWGFVNRIKMTMRRKYRFRGQLHSYFDAGCPAPKGFRAAVFPLAFATFSFSGHQQLSATINQRCGVSE